MNASELLSHLRELDVKVWLDGDRVRVNGPEHVLTSELKEQLRRQRPELETFLRRVESVADPESAMIPLQGAGTRPRFFCVPGHNGDVFCFLPLARRLGDDQPFFAYQPPGVDGKQAPLARIEALAGDFLRELKREQPTGPYRLGGYCTGGLVAFEAARQLAAEGAEVAALVLFGTSSPASYSRPHRVLALPMRALLRGRRALRRLAGTEGARPERLAPDANRRRLERATTAAARVYRPAAHSGDLTLFVPNQTGPGLFVERYADWSRCVSGACVLHAGPEECIHSTMLREPYVERVAERLRATLAESVTRA